MKKYAFIDNDGNEIANYEAFVSYRKANYVPVILDEVIYNDGVIDHIISIMTYQNNLGCAFKTVIECVEDNNCKYHGIIRECNDVNISADCHEMIKNKVIAGEDIPENEVM